MVPPITRVSDPAEPTRPLPRVLERQRLRMRHHAAHEPVHGCRLSVPQQSNAMYLGRSAALPFAAP